MENDVVQFVPVETSSFWGTIATIVGTAVLTGVSVAVAQHYLPASVNVNSVDENIVVKQN